MRAWIESSWLTASGWVVCAFVLAVVLVGGGAAYLLCRLGIRPQVDADPKKKWTRHKMRGAKLHECC